MGQNGVSLDQWFSIVWGWRDLPLPPKRHLAVSGDIFLLSQLQERVLLVSNGQRPARLFKILQGIEQSTSYPKELAAPNVNRPKVEKPCSRLRKSYRCGRKKGFYGK